MTKMNAKAAASDAPFGHCPMCRQPTQAKYRPFCSRRCADVDLSRWLRGRYAIAGGNSDADEDGDDARAADPVHFTDRNGDDPPETI